MEEELIAISSIFPCFDAETNTLSVGRHRIRFTFPAGYPETEIPLYFFETFIEKVQLQEIHLMLGQMYESSKPQVIMFEWINYLLEIFERCGDKPDEGKEDTSIEEMSKHVGWNYSITAGKDPIVDRKSIFVAYACSITNAMQVKEILTELFMQFPKTRKATHSMWAYRIEGNNAVQDCDDDGEKAAGGRLLHLLQILGIRNVMVIVSRWYGGIRLGADRFKHINNAARSVLQQSGYWK